MHLKMLSAKYVPFYLGLIVFKVTPGGHQMGLNKMWKSTDKSSWCVIVFGIENLSDNITQ